MDRYVTKATPNPLPQTVFHAPFGHRACSGIHGFGYIFAYEVKCYRHLGL